VYLLHTSPFYLDLYRPDIYSGYYDALTNVLPLYTHADAPQ